MNSHIDYKNLSKKDLELLVLADDRKAIDEHARRVQSGEIKPTRSYTLKDLDRMIKNQEQKSA